MKHIHMIEPHGFQIKLCRQYDLILRRFYQ